MKKIIAVKQKINLEHVQYIAHDLARQTMGWDEPIPPFETRFPNALESSITTPFMKYGNREFYKGLVAKSAILFYLMIKNHPFENGNKRIAVTTLFTFLYLNGYWLKVDTQVLYNFAKWVAASHAPLKDSTVGAIEEFIGLSVIEYKKRKM
jgi:death on curing protein